MYRKSAELRRIFISIIAIFTFKLMIQKGFLMIENISIVIPPPPPSSHKHIKNCIVLHLKDGGEGGEFFAIGILW